MRRLKGNQTRRVASLAIPVLIAASAALAQDEGALKARGAATDASPTSGVACRDLVAMTPAEAERMMYFIAGYQAALGGQEGSGGETTKGVIEASPSGEAEAPVDPRLNQVVTADPGGIYEINYEEVWSACQASPDRPAAEVLEEFRSADGSGAETAE